MAWFSSWFDTKYYHILYKNRDEKEAENFIQNLLKSHPIPENANVLDLACGKGRHAKIFADLGYKTLGLDLAKQSIEQAKKDYKAPNLSFAVHDMRLPYYSEKKFDAIFNLFTSFGYFDKPADNKRVFDSIHLQLKDTGVFFFDYLNCTPIVKTLPIAEEKSIDGIDFSLSKKVENGRIIKDITFTDSGQDFAFQESIEILSLAYMKALAEESGFILDKTYGNYDLDPFDEKSSKRMILLLKKNTAE